MCKNNGAAHWLFAYSNAFAALSMTKKLKRKSL
jgi:hypothetical protein